MCSLNWPTISLSAPALVITHKQGRLSPFKFGLCEVSQLEHQLRAVGWVAEVYQEGFTD